MRRLLILLVALATALIGAATALAAVSAFVSSGTVNPDGSATLSVVVTCDPGSRVLEAHVTLSQDDSAVWGTAGLGTIRCNGRANTYVVTVTPFSGSFHSGTAHASPYVLVQHRATGETASGGQGGEITLQ